jgi:hypothetical protein
MTYYGQESNGLAAAVPPKALWGLDQGVKLFPRERSIILLVKKGKAS